MDRGTERAAAPPAGVAALVGEIASTVVADLPLEEALARFFGQVVPAVLPGIAAALVLADEGGLRLAGASDPTVEQRERLALRLGAGPSPEAFTTGGPVGGPLGPDGPWPFLTAAGDPADRLPGDVAAIPLCHGTEPVGALALYGRGAATVPELGAAGRALADLATAYVVGARARERSRRVEGELRRLALHDSLTGLPNRTLFLDRLRLALARLGRHGGQVGVLFLDLDRFKLVNDSLGHAAGDRLLTEVSRRLRHVIRPSDTAARFGGDEFAVACEDLHGEQDAVRVAERIVAAMSEPIVLDQQREVVVTPSIGIALAGADVEPERLLQQADTAMYRAKDQGGAGYALFDDSLHAQALARLETEQELRRALERGELRLHYQPLIDLRTGRVHGVESLVRWQHPARGLLLPGEFVPLAEETDLIVPLGRWVLEEACRQVACWRSAHGPGQGSSPAAGPPLQVSVNLSPRQLASTQLLDDVAAAMSRHQISPDELSVEITERMLVEDAEAGVSVLHALKTFGVGIAVDDFGTGFSSLSYLQHFPIDRLKIDRSFVATLSQGDGDRSLAAAVVTLARALGVPVVAEGVETAEQLAELRRLGCDLAQGHLFARAEPAEEVERFVAAGTPEPPLVPPWPART